MEAGHVADLELPRENPLDDIANTRVMAGVDADGGYYSEADIEALRERLKKVAKAR